jgi:hypothetical protein
MMSFITRELEKLNNDLRANPSGERYAEIYAAQQALAWALDPKAYKSPAALLMGTLAGSADCSVDIHHSPLPDIPDPMSDAV